MVIADAGQYVSREEFEDLKKELEAVKKELQDKEEELQHSREDLERLRKELDSWQNTTINILKKYFLDDPG